MPPHDLAAAPRWTDQQTARLEGRCRGDLLGPWGDNLRRRFGDEAVTRVRARLPDTVRDVDPAPTKRDWLPVQAQLKVTEAIIDEILGGDAGALYPLLVDDTRRNTSRVKLAVLRALSPRRMLELAPRSFRKVYDVGAVTVEVAGNHARLDFTGADLFGHPTWRLLQVYAVRVLLELGGRTAEVAGEDLGDARFAVHVRW